MKGGGRRPAARLLMLALLLAPTTAAAETFQVGTVEIQSGAERHQFQVELAVTQAQQRQGLMHRLTLGENEGMLFLYAPPQRIRMWMKDTYIPLDMLFIRPDGTIAAIAEDTIPLSLTPIGPDVYVNGVLEVLAGTSERLGLRPGDRVRHPHFDAERGPGQ
ncbi:MAG: DUF192 domain-containing protein [Rhodospirillales bacterium]|nr:DUF192 domain-containing protein [Rhodospirillales bacterium]MDE0712190.1 DUF192 domain-containing protein [Rhodospirillales bacterium]